MKRQAAHGFTLIELMTVIVIIGILSGLLFTVLAQAKEAARKRRCATEVRELTRAWYAYWQAYGNLPEYGQMTPDAVKALQGNDPANNLKKIKFMDFPPEAAVSGYKDPWGQLYRLSLATDQMTNSWVFSTKVFPVNYGAYDYE